MRSQHTVKIPLQTCGPPWLTARATIVLQVKQLVHVSGTVLAGADALLVFGGQGVEQPDLLTLLPLPGADGEVGPRSL